MCFPTLRCTAVVVTDQIESIDEEGAKVEGVGCVGETDVFYQCFRRPTEEQAVIGSDFGQRYGVRLCMIVKVMEEVIDINSMFLVMEVCLWIIGYCLATSRKVDSVDPKRLTR